MSPFKPEKMGITECHLWGPETHIEYNIIIGFHSILFRIQEFGFYAPWWQVLALALNADPKHICFHCTSPFESKEEPCIFCETWEFHRTGKKPEWMEGN